MSTHEHIQEVFKFGKGNRTVYFCRTDQYPGEWFIAPSPCSLLALACEGVRMMNDPQYPLPFWMWSDIKRCCSDAVLPAVAAAIETNICNIETRHGREVDRGGQHGTDFDGGANWIPVTVRATPSQD